MDVLAIINSIIAYGSVILGVMFIFVTAVQLITEVVKRLLPLNPHRSGGICPVHRTGGAGYVDLLQYYGDHNYVVLRSRRSHYGYFRGICSNVRLGQIYNHHFPAEGLLERVKQAPSRRSAGGLYCHK